MFNSLRASRSSHFASAVRAFSTSRPLAGDVAKLTLVGRLVRDTEMRTTKNEKQYASYTVATTSSTMNQGERQALSTFHRVLCFNPSEFDYLNRLKKGSKVFVQADYSIKEPEPDADPATPQGQRHIFLTHDSLKVLNLPKQVQEVDAVSETSL